MKNLIPDGEHWLSGVCEKTFSCGYDGENSADGIVITIDGKNYGAYSDPDDGYRSYGAFFETEAKQNNTFPPQRVMVSNEEWDDQDENGWPHRGDAIRIYNIDTEKEIFCCGTIHDDSYYPVGFWHYYPENLPINIEREDKDKKFEDALSTLRECLGMKDKHEEPIPFPFKKYDSDASGVEQGQHCIAVAHERIQGASRIPTEKVPEITEYCHFEPGCDEDIDKNLEHDEDDDLVETITATEWQIMEHNVRERVKRELREWMDNDFDGCDTGELLAWVEDLPRK